MTRLNYEKAHKIDQGRSGIVYDPKTEYKTYLTVPYSEKEAAKALGAKWDKTYKSWYVEGSTQGFERWLEGSRYLKQQGTEKEVGQGEKGDDSFPHWLTKNNTTLLQYLRMKHATVNALTAQEAMWAGLEFPLKKGWVDRHGHEIIPDHMVDKLKAKKAEESNG